MFCFSVQRFAGSLGRDMNSCGLILNNWPQDLLGYCALVPAYRSSDKWAAIQPGEPNMSKTYKKKQICSDRGVVFFPYSKTKSQNSSILFNFTHGIFQLTPPQILSKTSGKHVLEMYTPLNPTFIQKKMGFAGV